MPDVDVTFELAKMYDESTPQRTGGYTHVKVYTFYLGKFGPFTERVPADGLDEQEIARRVQRLQAHLRDVNR